MCAEVTFSAGHCWLCGPLLVWQLTGGSVPLSALWTVLVGSGVGSGCILLGAAASFGFWDTGELQAPRKMS